MAIRDLLVAFNDDRGAHTALRFALQMASKHDAEVTGIYIYNPKTFSSSVRHWIPDDVFTTMSNAEAEAAKKIERSFRRAVVETGHSGPVHFRIETGQPDLTLARAARYHDLLLIGQFEVRLNSQHRDLQPEHLVERAGKPIVVIPADYELRPFKEIAAVAWDASRSAARALSDAMQILETKKAIDVLTIDTQPDAMAASGMPEFDIAQHLKRHGIVAQHLSLEASARGIGEAILDHCAQNDPDVLVMGAIGRSKMVSRLFGSVTSHILENMTVPVLLSH